jgi:hypothetical protein
MKGLYADERPAASSDGSAAGTPPTIDEVMARLDLSGRSERPVHRPVGFRIYPTLPMLYRKRAFRDSR